MPSRFEFQPYDNSHATATIGELMQLPARARAQALRAAGAANARNAEQQGQIGAQLAGSLGQIATQQVGDYQQRQLDAPRLAMGKLALGEAQRREAADKTAQANEQAAAEAIAQIQGGNVEAVLGRLPPQARTVAEGYLANTAKANQARKEILDTQRADAAKTIRDIGTLPDGSIDPVTAATVWGLHAKDDQEAAQIWDQVKGDPVKLKQVVDHYAGPRKFTTAAPGAGIINEQGQVTGTVPRDPATGGYTINGQRFDATGKPIGAAVAPPKSYQSKDVLVGGRPSVANFDPQTGKYFDASGAELQGVKPIPPVAAVTREAGELEVLQAARNIVANPRDLTSIRNITSLRGDQRMKLFNEIKRIDPSFNVGMIDRQIKFLDSYEDPKGRAAINRSAMNNILMHAADLNAVNQEYQRTNVRLLNMPVNKIRAQYSDAYTAFEVPLTVLKDEIALYFAGGYAPFKEQEATWNQIASDNATPNQIARFAKEIVHVGLRRADTHNQQFKTMMGYDDPNLLTPDAVAAGKQIGGLDAQLAKYGSGGQLGKAAPVTRTNPFRK